jgi:hypothetical protein
MKVEIRASTINKLVKAVVQARGAYGMDEQEQEYFRTKFRAILAVPRKLHQTKDFKQSTD